MRAPVGWAAWAALLAAGLLFSGHDGAVAAGAAPPPGADAAVAPLVTPPAGAAAARPAGSDRTPPPGGAASSPPTAPTAGAAAGAAGSNASSPPAPGGCPPLTLALVGDVMMGRQVDAMFDLDDTRLKGGRPLFDLGELLAKGLDPNTTIVAGNLEMAITNNTDAVPKVYNFKLSPRNAGVLADLGFDWVSTANNHVLDYGLKGMADTHDNLGKLGIAHSGSGNTTAQAEAPVFVTRTGHKVAFLAYADHPPEWRAGPSTPGTNVIDSRNFNASQLKAQIDAARAAGADLVVVSLHVGPNWLWQPANSTRQLGEALVRAGADVVFGHSAHHVQGVQFVNGKPIIYATGDFFTDYAPVDEYRNDRSAVWIARFAATAVNGTAAAAAGRRCRLQLESLVARPTQQWLDYQGRAEFSKRGLPSYLSKVRLAPAESQDPAYKWVVDKLTNLSSAYGTRAAPLPGGRGLQLLPPLAQSASAAPAVAPGAGAAAAADTAAVHRVAVANGTAVVRGAAAAANGAAAMRGAAAAVNSTAAGNLTAGGNHTTGAAGAPGNAVTPAGPLLSQSQ